MKIRIGTALAILASLLLGVGPRTPPAEAQTIISVPCAITNPGWNSTSGCARTTWHEGIGQFCWYHQLKHKDYGWVRVSSKHAGQTQWRVGFADNTVDGNWIGGCAPKRGQTGALPRPTAVRIEIRQLDGRSIFINFETVLIG